MTEEPIRNVFQSPTLRRLYKVALPSAAVAIATAAAIAGVFLSQPAASGATQVAAASPTVDAGIPNPEKAPATPDSPTLAATPGSATSAAATEPASASKAAAPAVPSEKVLNVSFEYQPNYYYCGPAAVHNALTARGVDLSQDELAIRLRTTANGTDSAEDTTRALNSVVGAGVYQTRTIPGQDATPAQMDQLQADAVHAISNGYALVANIVGGDTDVDGIWHDFPGGHYIALVGYRDSGRTVQVSDSSGMFGASTYWMSTINMANWIGTRGYSA